MGFKTDIEALVLGVLQNGASHGYEIAKRINGMDENLFRVGEGKLYPTLHKLEEDGLVSADWVNDDTKKPRKVYAITDKGRKELEKKQQTWQRFAAGVNGLIMQPKEAGNG